MLQTLLDVSAVPGKDILMLPCLMDQGQRKLTAVATAVKVAAQGDGLKSVFLASHSTFSNSTLRNL